MSFLNYHKQNPDFLNNYLKYKRYIEFGLETTVNEIYFDLRTLFRYIKLYLYDKDKLNNISSKEFKNININDLKIEDFRKITENDLERYIIFLNNTLNNNSKTRNRKLSSAKKFFKYLEINNLIGTNPARNINFAKIEKRVPKYLDLNESKKLLSNILNSSNKYKIRNYAITCIFLNCSLRLSELTKINLTDLKIDNSEQTLKVYGKGNKERLIYLNVAVREAIKAYLEVRTPLGKNNKDYNALFLSSQNKRISNRAVETIIKQGLRETLEENKNVKNYHTHTLRHTSNSEKKMSKNYLIIYH